MILSKIINFSFQYSYRNITEVQYNYNNIEHDIKHKIKYS